MSRVIPTTPQPECINMRRIPLTIMISLLALTCFSQVQKVKITDLEKMIADSKGPMIINFWATWCKPCVDEIPYFLEELKDNKNDSLRLILVSLDGDDQFPDALNKFVVKRKYEKARLLWLDETNADYFCPKVDPKWSGAIPASLFINNNTGYRNFIEEQISHEKLKEEVKRLKG